MTPEFYRSGWNDLRGAGHARWFIDFSVRNDFSWKMVGASWLGLASFWRGQWDDARSHIARSLEFQQQMRHPTTAWSVWSNAVMVKAYTGDGDVGALLGQAAEAASLYPFVLEALDTGTVTEFQTMELLQNAAGTAAAAGGQWDAAEGHYRTALRQAKELPHRIAQPEVRRSYARMLLDRKAAGGADRHGSCWARRSRCMGRSECPGMWRWRRGCYVSSEGHWFKRSGFESRRCRRHQRKTLRMDEGHLHPFPRYDITRRRP